MAGDKDGRTEKATPKRRREARRRGQVPRSPELTGWLLVLVGTWLLPTVVRKGYSLTAGLLTDATSAAAHPSSNTALRILGHGLSGVVGIVLPVGAALAAVAVVGGLAQTGGAVSTHALRPQLSRLSPVAGVKRIFSPQSAWQTAKSILRVVLLGLIGWRAVDGVLNPLLGAGSLGLFDVAALAARTALSAARTMAALSLGIAVIDYALQRRRITRSLRMSKQEVKDEARNSDGNPLIKGAIRRRQRAMSRNRMMAAVASADAVVVNPTHVAVALRYEAGRGAPRVVAKGADELAARIRAEAEAHDVPLVRDIPLARALYGAVEVGQEIPRDLYQAVAKLLSFLYLLRASGRLHRLDGAPHVPPAPLLAA